MIKQIMKIFITAKPRSKREYVKKVDNDNYVVAVKEPAEDGKANNAVVKALAEYLDISPSQIIITSGHTSRRKVLEVVV